MTTLRTQQSETPAHLVAQVAAEAWQDPEFAAAVRGINLQVLFDFGGTQLRLRLAEEKAGASSAREDNDDIVISAPGMIWEQVITPVPPPGYQSFTALRRSEPQFTVTGDPVSVARALHALERFFELMRGDPNTGPQESIATDPSAVTGHYADLRSSTGARCRIHYERAGSGIPVVFLHTAGADSRQFHHLLCDTGLGREWAMHAFDMPLHGRSFPPDDWQAAAYSLTESEYAGWCVAFISEIIRKPCVVIGCSMGAAISMRLAAEHRERLLAVVALEAPDRAPGRRSPLLCSPDVNQASHNPSYVRGLMSPLSPLRHRRLACWYYSQGGLGIYSGDLQFYSEEYDGIQYAHRIDASRLPMFFLTGEYDYSASPASTKRLVSNIPGARFVEMKGLGHFPMTENPQRFQEYLAPVLSEIKQRLNT